MDDPMVTVKFCKGDVPPYAPFASQNAHDRFMASATKHMDKVECYGLSPHTIEVLRQQCS